MSIRNTAERLSDIERFIFRVENIVLVIATTVGVVHAGFTSASQQQDRELSLLVLTTMGILSATRLTRFLVQLHLSKNTGLGQHRRPRIVRLLVPGIWLLLGIGCSLASADVLATADVTTRLQLWVRVTEALLIVMALLAALRLGQYLAAVTQNSSLLLAGSFLALITVGTLLLRLPTCRAAIDEDGTRESAPWNVALFTATSAACVTGLIVVPTGSYWSSAGHAVILCLIQFGGLGILTFGAFMAVLSRHQKWQFREAATLSELLDSESMLSARQLLRMIVFFTITTELIGTVFLLGLWEDEPALWYSLFHSVSAFCNAGFSLRDEGFMGLAGRWQVSITITTLIILGGLGFSVIQDIVRTMMHRRETGAPIAILTRPIVRRRLSVHTRIVLVTAVILLAIGGTGYVILESLNQARTDTAGALVLDGWFQTVTFRTAGFNTVDHATLHPATKLLAMFLMFIGAAPGSTGGGVKTVVFALMVLNLVAVMKGREHVEVFGRSIPVHQVSRSLAIVGAGLVVVLTTAGLLMVFEQDTTRSIDYLFEATSAFATVGVSAGVTDTLSIPSRLVIILVMFLGRIGPITLLLAMSVQKASGGYLLPEERVSLG
jgi:trk system potassium uptake protein TrkH